MNESEEKRAAQAATAQAGALEQFLHDFSHRVVRSVLGNRNLSEEDVLIIASRKNLAADLIETIAKDRRWSESYPIRLALALNPRTPLHVSLGIARFLRIFDLEEITRNHQVPIVFRRKVEAMIIERVPAMPLGNKKTLAKKAAGNVLLKLLQDRIPEVVRLCLDNPRLVESHLFKVISRPDTIHETVLMISRHALWSARPLIRLSLVRNAHTPLSTTVRFLKGMKLGDLRDLYADPALPVTIKPFVHRELLERGSDPASTLEERVYEIREEEFAEAEVSLERFGAPEEDTDKGTGDHRADGTDKAGP